MPPPRSRRRSDEDDDDRPRRRRDDEEEDEEDDRPRSRRRRDDEEDDYDDRPRRGRGRAKGSNGLATTALVLGVLSLCFGMFTGIPAAICGVLGLTKASKVGTGKGMAVAGLLLGLFGTLLSVVGIILAITAGGAGGGLANFGPLGSSSKKTSNDLKEIGLYAHHFHDANGTFPGSFHRPTDGKAPPADPNARLSWRYSLLPYGGEDALYKRFAQSEPWDSPANRPASNTPVRLYCSTETAGSSQTRYRVFVGGGAVFDADPPRFGGVGPPQTARPPSIVGITDGTSNTILAVEAADTVPWAQHNELKFDPNGPLPRLGRPGRDSFVVLLCDGSTRTVKQGFNQEIFKKMVTRAGGEVVQPDW